MAGVSRVEFLPPEAAPVPVAPAVDEELIPPTAEPEAPRRRRLWLRSLISRLTVGVVLVLVLYAVTAFALNQTGWGKHVYAVGDDAEAARLVGIRVNRVLLSVYTVAGLIYGITAWILIGRAGYRVTIELSPRRVVAGERAFGRLLVANSGPRRSAAGRLELPVGRALAEFDIPALAPAQEHDELFAVPTARRAVISAGPAVAVRGDQLGLLRRRAGTSDRRRVVLEITRKGEALINRLLPKMWSELDLSMRALSTREKLDLERLLKKLATALDAKGQPA